MAATNTIEVVIKATDKATRELKQLDRDLGGLGNVFREFGKGVAAGGVAITGFLVAAKGIMAVGEHGAVVAQTAESFELLTEKVGASANLLGQLKTASKNTIPDLQLMSSTTTLLAGAQGELATSLANATPELLEIAKAANKLNPSLGDTTFLYQSLATGIKRASPLILDNLGLTISVGDANRKMAESLGKSVDELTAEEQKMALLNETIRAGRVLIDQAGGSADSAADDFMRLNAELQNMKDNFSAEISGPIADVVHWLTEFVSVSQEEERIIAEIERGTLANARSYEEYRTQLQLTLGVISRSIQVQENGAIVIKSITGLEEALVKQTRARAREEFNLLKASEQYTVMLPEQERALALLNEAYATGNQELLEYTVKIPEATQATTDFVSWTEKAAHAGTFMAESTAQISDRMSALRTLMSGPVGNEMERFAERQDTLKAKARELRDQIAELEGKRYLTASQRQDLVDWQTELQNVQGEMAKVREEHEKAMKGIAFDLAMAQLETDGLTTREANLATALAEKLGLVDDATADMMQGVNAALDDFAKGKGMDDVLLSFDAILERAQGIPSAMDEAFRGLTTQGVADPIAALFGTGQPTAFAPMQGLQEMTRDAGNLKTELIDAYTQSETLISALQNPVTSLGDMVVGTTELAAEMGRTLTEDIPADVPSDVHIKDPTMLFEQMYAVDGMLKLWSSKKWPIRVEFSTVNMPGPAGLPMYQGGTDFHPGGVAVVGENGPELVNLPRGAQVIPGGTSPGTANLTFNINGAADPSVITNAIISELRARGVIRTTPLR